MTYAPPLGEIRYTLSAIAGLQEITALPGYESAGPGVVDAVLEEAGRLAADVLAPLNHSGDREGSRLENGVVRTPAGFRDAYRTYSEGGWGGLAVAEEDGGQGLPLVVAMAAAEMWHSANMALALCPMLTESAIHALSRHGSASLRATYLPHLVTGRWTGTMNLTEPQAGSDVGAIKTRAIRDGEHYRIKGQKIFISYGDHDLTENIIHLVLARLPEAAAGTRGLSLFLVPKYLPDLDGRIGSRNDVRCVSLEHKLGIRASPTATLAFGDEDGAIGFLVGEEGRGMECMFTMMNNAPLAVGVQGLALSERAYQQARAFAFGRLQGLAPGPVGGTAIAGHPDVRRMLLLMQSRTMACRALAYYTASMLDLASRASDITDRAKAAKRAALLVPIVKAWCTDVAVENTSLALQVHGGMGYIEETGAAQHYRDSRITPIYEGTNGIQAIDLVGRKVAADGGEAMRALIGEMRQDLGAESCVDKRLQEALCDGLDALDRATDWLLQAYSSDRALALSGATPYLALCAAIIGGWLLAKGLGVADKAGSPAGAMSGRLTVARFYAEQVVPVAVAFLPAIIGGETVLSLEPDLL